MISGSVLETEMAPPQAAAVQQQIGVAGRARPRRRPWVGMQFSAETGDKGFEAATCRSRAATRYMRRRANRSAVAREVAISASSASCWRKRRRMREAAAVARKQANDARASASRLSMSLRLKGTAITTNSGRSAEKVCPGDASASPSLFDGNFL